MSPPKPSRRAAVAPFMAMDVLRQARRLEQAGRQIIHMELGEPGAPAPLLVREAAAAALRDGRLGYGEAMGDAVLRERIARHYAEHYGVEVASDRVMVTTGSSGAFLLAFLAGFDAGARVGVVQPGYPAYANILEALGLSLAPIEVGPETRFAPTVELIEAAHRRERLDGLLLMSPANPTGAMIAPAELEKICAFCEDAGVVLVSDEIYHRLEYEGRAETALRFSRGAIVVNSFSKYYAMTGWRLGWAIAPAKSGATYGAIAAITGHLRADVVAARRAGRLRRRRGTRNPSSEAMRAAARCCCASCRESDCRCSRRRTEPFTSTPTFRI